MSSNVKQQVKLRPDLQLASRDLSSYSIFRLLEEKHGMLLQGGEQRIGVASANRREARLLGILKGAPLGLDLHPAGKSTNSKVRLGGL